MTDWTTIWKPLPEAQPRKALVEGFVCSSGKHSFLGADGSGYRAAAYCCGPWVCKKCDRPMLRKGYTWCEGCKQADEASWWLSAPRVEASDEMILAGDLWFDTLADFLQHCEDEGADPASMQPWIGEFVPVRTPEVAELICDDMGEDWDGDDWLRALQDQVDEAFRKNKPGGWRPGGSVPVLPAPAVSAND